MSDTPLAIEVHGLYVDPDTHCALTGVYILDDGSTAHLRGGLVHRPIEDGPAKVAPDGTKFYMVMGALDRVVYPWQTDVSERRVRITVRRATEQVTS